jgi:hypothetical protein
MARRVMRIAPWQAGKVFAVLYFIFGLVFAIPLALFGGLAGQGGFGMGFALVFPFIYAIGGLIIVPLCCLVYNVVAKLVGGLEFDVVDHDANPA